MPRAAGRPRVLAVRVARAGVPLLVVASVALLGAAAILTVARPRFDATKEALFVAGVGAWILGIGWGVVVNGRAAAR